MQWGHYQNGLLGGGNPPSRKRVYFDGMGLGLSLTMTKQRARCGKRVKKTTSGLQLPYRKSVKGHQSIAEKSTFSKSADKHDCYRLFSLFLLLSFIYVF